MAASDPTPYVATPTGTLQGVAAFSWDGSAWQPSGRAGPDVATSTGVLQGVAPFSWSGSAWTPAGQAQPGVATPTGVLDGVAVYTWSGSAWTPTGGTATPATPSGALRGVAAFGWDGAAWQPAAQARASVPTPYGVLDGVAMFSWTGSAWTAGQPSLDLSFMTGTLDPSLTFTRGSTGTYFDSSGVMQTAAINAPRWDYDPVTHAARGLLLEDQRTNLLLNSATLGTQSVAVTAQAYTLSFYGTGSITLSGVSTAGPLTGTGAFPQRVFLTFTPTAGTLTLTVTGSVVNAQLETNDFSTSYIPTAGAAATRNIDQCLVPPANMGWFTGSPGGSWYVEFDYFDNTPTNCRVVCRPDFSGGPTPTIINASRIVGQYDLSVGVNAPNATTVNTVVKALTTWTAGQAKSCVNGGTLGTSGSSVNGYAIFATTGIRFVSCCVALNSDNCNGHIRRVRYWPRILSDVEMQSVTT